MLTILLVVLLVLLLLGSAPVWPYSRGYGWGPSSGIVGILVIVLLVLLLTGRL
jgi:hypothetical protein